MSRLDHAVRVYAYPYGIEFRPGPATMAGAKLTRQPRLAGTGQSTSPHSLHKQTSFSRPVAHAALRPRSNLTKMYDDTTIANPTFQQRFGFDTAGNAPLGRPNKLCSMEWRCGDLPPRLLRLDARLCIVPRHRRRRPKLANPAYHHDGAIPAPEAARGKAPQVQASVTPNVYFLATNSPVRVISATFTVYKRRERGLRVKIPIEGRPDVGNVNFEETARCVIFSVVGWAGKAAFSKEYPTLFST